ncbi:MAG: PQQ-dependent sugar dehydrogenase [Brevundimonas sp.]|uniref:PQQ-dependent sugar dehydrogenase n=1 Tax=Brevundimonas sp. TaxID=1871086 RepID=UPI00391C5EB1
MRLSALTVAVSVFALAAACGGNGETASSQANGGTPVESNPPNAANQQPAFEGQTRAPGVQTTVRMTSETVAEGLENPWGLVPLPGGGFLITEKPGRLRLVSAEGEIGEAIAGVPQVVSDRQAGLMDVQLSPDFAGDRLVYLSFSEPRQGGNGTALARGRLSDDGTRLENVQTIFRAMPTYDNFMHYGSRIVFDREGRVYLTLGERSSVETRDQAQDLGSHFGKIVRVNADGSVPADNPFVNQDGALPEIWSWGHRNVQGAALHPETGELWAVEHGARGGDEINIARAGENYGWPIAAYGIEYRGGAIGEGATTAPGTVQPIYYWDPSIATGGAAFYRGEMFPDWNGNLLVTALAGQHLARLVLDGDRVAGEERLLTGLGERIRDVAVGDDGAVYVVTDEQNGRLVRLRRAD